MANVLVACEESQRVCKAFRDLGHNAFSCDLQECSGGHPEWHIMNDCAIPMLKYVFDTMDGKTHFVEKWDLIIAHPPCTYLTVTGNRWFNVDKYGINALVRLHNRDEAVNFFIYFVKYAHAYNCKMAIENPIGVMSTRYRKPDQIIQPYFFGDHARKSTCLWLYDLPKLMPTNIVDPGIIQKGGYSEGASANGKWLRYNDPELAKMRSKTFPGIANAMAEQWGNLL